MSLFHHTTEVSHMYTIYMWWSLRDQDRCMTVRRWIWRFRAHRLGFLHFKTSYRLLSIILYIFVDKLIIFTLYLLYILVFWHFNCKLYPTWRWPSFGCSLNLVTSRNSWRHFNFVTSILRNLTVFTGNSYIRNVFSGESVWARTEDIWLKPRETYRVMIGSSKLVVHLFM